MTSSVEEEETGELDGQFTRKVSLPVWQLLFFLLMWQWLYNVSNAAMNTLLRFLQTFVRLFGQTFAPDVENPHRVTEEIPISTSTALDLLHGTNGDEYIVYVVCPKCSSVYEYDDCVVYRGGSSPNFAAILHTETIHMQANDKVRENSQTCANKGISVSATNKVIQAFG